MITLYELTVTLRRQADLARLTQIVEATGWSWSQLTTEIVDWALKDPVLWDRLDKLAELHAAATTPSADSGSASPAPAATYPHPYGR